MNQVQFKVEGIVKVRNPLSPAADVRGYVDDIKTIEGCASFDEQGEINFLFIDEVKVGKAELPKSKLDEGIVREILNKIFR